MRLKSDFLNEALERGFFYQATNIELLDEKLSKGQCAAYNGFDATAESLHVGHLLPIFLLRLFQKHGHKPIALVGGGTTKIGDPTFRNSMRPILDDETLAKNISGLKYCLSKYIDFNATGNNAAQLLDNAQWLDDLKYIPFLREIGINFSINRMLTFDSVKGRLEQNESLSFLEFNYMIIQAYDFLEIYKTHGAEIQFGGQDQWGNIVCGVELIKKKLGKEVIGYTVPLLTKSDGEKMGKSASGAVWLSEKMLSPYDFWQYWRNIPDDMVGKCLRLFTDLPISEIKKMETLQGQEVNEAKIILANEITTITHGEMELQNVSSAVARLFGSEESAENVPCVYVTGEFSLIDILLEKGLVGSRSEAKRLIRGNGVSVDGKIVDEEYKPLETNRDLQVIVGKKKSFLVKFK